MKINKLTDTAVRNAKPGAKDYRLSDGAGLYLVVKTNGSKLWRWSFEFQGKEKLLSYGQYPIVTLAKAREVHQEARLQKASGVDPTVVKKQAQKIKEKKEAEARQRKLSKRWHVIGSKLGERARAVRGHRKVPA